ncbi:hypothetical protein HRM2_25590 [Desulforapulum autotrophicum HRM2]|uniref:Uncharacterized protein n=1 Tax=Desulforapulum autotrophicum (strain ATCC 43914 / DSM 3382 / VKM B-1955 / HRM2) TaxID=177437 RepID=C0QH04_DESAH|nr:hypothetical protein [Desulforapulum autotrophicum]ACN15653.1 hypothetical protein HRM2_25590 [Desulforapulum autotrophicum HRM2]
MCRPFITSLEKNRAIQEFADNLSTLCRAVIPCLAKALLLVFAALGPLHAEDPPRTMSASPPAINSAPPRSITPAIDPNIKTIQSRYTTITYSDVKALRKFNNKLYMGNLKYLLKGKKSDTIEDEVKNKIDLIVEKVETVLDMYPATLRFNIVIHGSTRGVQAAYQRIYHRKVNYIAFFSPGEKTVFYSANNAKLRVVTHEIGHVVAENYFAISPPPKIHEVLAQYAEMHIND